MLQKHQTRVAAEQSLDSRLKALMEQVAKEADASYAFLLLYDQDTSQLHNAVWYGREEEPENCLTVAWPVLSRGEPICLQGEADAKEIVGFQPDKSLLPLLCAPVMSNAIPRGILVMGSPQSAREAPFPEEERPFRDLK